MTKEAELRALREITGTNLAHNGPHKAEIVRVDDIAVMKYLDGLRRKATSVEEVDIIDVIVKCLFHEGINKVTGRLHGERVEEKPRQKSSEEMSAEETKFREAEKAKEAKRIYQRDLMRKRRAEAKAAAQGD